MTCPRCGTENRPGARFCRACGTALTTATPRLRLRLPRLPRRRKLWIAGIAGAVLLVLCGGYLVLQDTWYTPDEPVRQLFAALSARDAAALAGMDECGTVCAAGGLSRGYQPPTGLQIVGVDYGGAAPDDPTRRPDRNRAAVRVRYQVAGRWYDDVVGVERPDAGFLRRWGLAGPPGGYLQVVSDGLAKATVAGATVDTVAPAPDLPHDVGRTFVPPGVYTVGGTESALWETVPVTVTVAGDLNRFGPDAGQRVTLDLRVKPTVVDQVRQQIHQRIDVCAAKASFSPVADPSSIVSDCPFSALENYTLTQNLKWTVLDYPDIELRIGDDHTVGVKTVKPGHARLDYEYSYDILEPRRWTPTSQTVEVSPGGTVVEDNGAVVWSR